MSGSITFNVGPAWDGVSYPVPKSVSLDEASRIMHSTSNYFIDLECTRTYASLEGYAALSPAQRETFLALLLEWHGTQDELLATVKVL